MIRRGLHLLGLVAAFFTLIKLTNLTINLFLFPKLRPVEGAAGRANSADHPDRTDLSGVALLIPMRNEVDRLPETLPGLLESGARTITFLDDGSTDGSAEFVLAAADRAFAAGNRSRIQVLTGRPRPASWAGKTWACAQLAESCDADLMVYCDADVRLAPGALAAAVEQMRRQGSDVFSIFPGQQMVSLPERILIPLIDNTLLCFLPFPLLSVPVPAAATANGSVLAFTAKAYQELNAFEVVKGSLAEDVAIARLTRAAGLNLGLALGGEMVRVRMFSTFEALIKGLGRGLSPLGSRHPQLLVMGWLLQGLVYTAPPVLASRIPIWRLVAGLGVLERCLIEIKTGNRDWLVAVVPGLAPIFGTPVVVQALRRAQTWKGRTYE